jgi:dTDP-4-amino-4,6-dideoxygalactose transaminase
VTLHESAVASLALYGGTPVRTSRRPWPRWPDPSPDAERNILQVLHGDRWTLTSPLSGTELFERRFARMFAAYTGVRHCVPVDHGASAVVVALEALGLDYGDRVLVPALTWVASASAALRAGLVPVLTDVDPATGSMSVDDLDPDVGARAAVVVHWSCAMADVPALVAAGAEHGITIVEDCAQAHGAEWHGRRAGSMGRLGCFSMQHGKVLTSGEGGAVVTDDDDLVPVIEELRSDARRYRDDQGMPGESELVESGGTMGSNFCLSEFHAAVLCGQLPYLDGQHDVRRRNYEILDELLADVPGVRLLRPSDAQTRMSIFELPVLFDELPAGMTPPLVAEALTAELGVRFYQTDLPLHRSRLFQPSTKPAFAPLAREFAAYHEGRRFERADWFFDHSVVTHHSTLLGGEEDMVDIATALAKLSHLID